MLGGDLKSSDLKSWFENKLCDFLFWFETNQKSVIFIFILNQISKDLNDFHDLKSSQNKFPDSNLVILNF